MALKRADIRKILENAETSNDDKAKAILDALHEETDALRDELDTEKNARVAAEKERDAANSGKQTAEQALTDYKDQQTKKDARALRRELLKVAVEELGMEQSEALQANLEVFTDGYLFAVGVKG